MVDFITEQAPFLIEHRWLLFVAASGASAGFVVYFHLSHEPWYRAIFSWQMIAVLAPLVLAWGIAYWVLYAPSPSNSPQKLVICVARFDKGTHAGNLAREVERQLANQLALFPEAELRVNGIREIVQDERKALRLARAKRIHFVVYGSTQALSTERHLLTANLLQPIDWQGVNLGGGYAWQLQAKLNEFAEIKRSAKDITEKVIRTLYQTSLLAAPKGISITVTGNYAEPVSQTTFNLGTNLTPTFQIGDSRTDGTSLVGLIDVGGRVRLDGTLFDSDGNETVELEDGRVKQAGASIEVAARDGNLVIKDRYGRLLFRVEFERLTLQQRTSRGLSDTTVLPPQAQNREILTVVSIEGEFYDRNGRFLSIVTSGDVFQFSRNVRLF